MTLQAETRLLKEHAVRSEEYVLRAMATVVTTPGTGSRGPAASATAAIVPALLDVTDRDVEHGAGPHD